MPKLAEVAGVRIVVWLKEHHPVPHVQTVGEPSSALPSTTDAADSGTSRSTDAACRPRLAGSQPRDGRGRVASRSAW